MRTLGLLLALLVVVGTVPAAVAKDRHHTVRAQLSGFNEVIPPGGAVSTPARGQFTADIDEDAQVIHYELSYEGLEFPVSQAHIHFGQLHTAGGIAVWLCETTDAPAPDAVAAATPDCPRPEGTVTGTIRPAQVIGPAGQGIAAGEFVELVRAIRAGATYANVHSGSAGPPLVGFPSGEIRGQIRGGRD
jgi:hypothetical protein